jgi:PAS domain S-box-containing protein
MFGYKADELLGQPLEILIPERFRQNHVHHRTRYSRDPHTRPMGAGLELFGRRKDGAEFPVDIMLSPWELADQRLFLAVVRDISERKKIEEALERSRQELEVQVDKRTAELTQANESLRDEATRLSAIIDTQQDLALAGRDLPGALTVISGKTQQLTYSMPPQSDCLRPVGAKIRFMEIDNPGAVGLSGAHSQRVLMSSIWNECDKFTPHGLALSRRRLAWLVRSNRRLSSSLLSLLCTPAAAALFGVPREKNRRLPPFLTRAYHSFVNRAWPSNV